jgi:hypothetical protein
MRTAVRTVAYPTSGWHDLSICECEKLNTAELKDVEVAAERRHGRGNDAFDRDKCEDVALADVGSLGGFAGLEDLVRLAPTQVS